MDIDKIKKEREIEINQFDRSDIDRISKKNLLNKGFKNLWAFAPPIVLIIIILILFVSIGAKKETIDAERLKSQADTETSLVNVVAMDIIPKSISEKLNLPGTVNPWKELTVLTEVAGMIVDKKIKEGDQVKKGDVIAVVDDAKYRNLYNSAKAAYKSALASKKRTEVLYKKNLSNKAEYDQKTANMESAKAGMKNAQIDLRKCRVVATMGGTVNKVFFEEGQFLKNGSKVVSILQLDKLKVRVGIPESDMSAVRKLNHFKITVDALGDKEFIGRKYFLSRTTGNAAQLYDLIIEVDNSEGDLFPDMFTRVEIIKRTVPDAVTLPLYSIISSSEKHIVYVLEEGVVQSREVNLGIQEGLEIEISKGLKVGDQVLVRGQRSVNNGQKVKINQVITSIKELN
ncbi:MAG: efflux RND transporter periplasmic adaptor subunit [Desulfobacterales bacterium]|nr:efflux RND transporter periplasmic adaptor subunit [Desulfobacterales bacterium]